MSTSARKSKVAPAKTLFQNTAARQVMEPTRRPVPASHPNQTPEVAKCPIVVIGASAGGLEAFKEFFSSMPAAPAAVLIDRKYEIISVHGPVVNYLEFPRGKLSHDLMFLARDNLRTRIRSACHKAIRTGRTVHESGTRVRREGRYFLCDLSVRPILEPGQPDGLLLWCFKIVGGNSKTNCMRRERICNERSRNSRPQTRFKRPPTEKSSQ